MEIRLTRYNMYTFPIYVSLFEKYPKLEEIHLWSQWAHGYFGSSYNSYAEVNGKRVNPHKLWLLAAKNDAWKEITDVLENL